MAGNLSEGHRDSDSDSDAARSDQHGVPLPPHELLTEPCELQDGTACILLEHDHWTHRAAVAPHGQFVVYVEGKRGDHLIKGDFTLPSTLETAHRMDFCMWNSIICRIHDTFAGLLNDEQDDALQTLAYIYLWFARTPHPSTSPLTTANEADETETRTNQLWESLQVQLLTASAMGIYLDTPGEDLLKNVEGWARQNGISDAFPEPLYLPTLSNAGSAGSVGGQELSGGEESNSDISDMPPLLDSDSPGRYTARRVD